MTGPVLDMPTIPAPDDDGFKLDTRFSIPDDCYVSGEIYKMDYTTITGGITVIQRHVFVSSTTYNYITINGISVLSSTFGEGETYDQEDGAVIKYTETINYIQNPASSDPKDVVPESSHSEELYLPPILTARERRIKDTIYTYITKGSELIKTISETIIEKKPFIGISLEPPAKIRTETYHAVWRAKNGLHDSFEPYEDLNGNWRWDEGEPFSDIGDLYLDYIVNYSFNHTYQRWQWAGTSAVDLNGNMSFFIKPPELPTPSSPQLVWIDRSSGSEVVVEEVTYYFVPDYEAGPWTGESWSGGTDWTGKDWTGDNWHYEPPGGTDWTAPPDWSGTLWTGVDWFGMDWYGQEWEDPGDGGKWAGTQWADGTIWDGTWWIGSDWYGETTEWQGSPWSGGGGWTGTDWTGKDWTGDLPSGTSWEAGSWEAVETEAWTGYETIPQEYTTPFELGAKNSSGYLPMVVVVGFLTADKFLENEADLVRWLEDMGCFEETVDIDVLYRAGSEGQDYYEYTGGETATAAVSDYTRPTTDTRTEAGFITYYVRKLETAHVPEGEPTGFFAIAQELQEGDDTSSPVYDSQGRLVGYSSNGVVLVPPEPPKNADGTMTVPIHDLNNPSHPVVGYDKVDSEGNVVEQVRDDANGNPITIKSDGRNYEIRDSQGNLLDKGNVTNKADRDKLTQFAKTLSELTVRDINLNFTENGNSVFSTSATYDVTTGISSTNQRTAIIETGLVKGYINENKNYDAAGNVTSTGRSGQILGANGSSANIPLSDRMSNEQFEAFAKAMAHFDFAVNGEKLGSALAAMGGMSLKDRLIASIYDAKGNLVGFVGDAKLIQVSAEMAKALSKATGENVDIMQAASIIKGKDDFFYKNGGWNNKEFNRVVSNLKNIPAGDIANVEAAIGAVNQGLARSDRISTSKVMIAMLLAGLDDTKKDIYGMTEKDNFMVNVCKIKSGDIKTIDQAVSALNNNLQPGKQIKVDSFQILLTLARKNDKDRQEFMDNAQNITAGDMNAMDQAIAKLNQGRSENSKIKADGFQMFAMLASKNDSDRKDFLSRLSNPQELAAREKAMDRLRSKIGTHVGEVFAREMSGLQLMDMVFSMSDDDVKNLMTKTDGEIVRDSAKLADSFSKAQTQRGSTNTGIDRFQLFMAALKLSDGQRANLDKTSATDMGNGMDKAKSVFTMGPGNAGMDDFQLFLFTSSLSREGLDLLISMPVNNMKALFTSLKTFFKTFANSPSLAGMNLKNKNVTPSDSQVLAVLLNLGGEKVKALSQVLNSPANIATGMQRLLNITGQNAASVDYFSLVSAVISIATDRGLANSRFSKMSDTQLSTKFNEFLAMLGTHPGANVNKMDRLQLFMQMMSLDRQRFDGIKTGAATAVGNTVKDILKNMGADAKKIDPLQLVLIALGVETNATWKERLTSLVQASTLEARYEATKAFLASVAGVQGSSVQILIAVLNGNVKQDAAMAKAETADQVRAVMNDIINSMGADAGKADRVELAILALGISTDTGMKKRFDEFKANGSLGQNYANTKTVAEKIAAAIPALKDSVNPITIFIVMLKLSDAQLNGIATPQGINKLATEIIVQINRNLLNDVKSATGVTFAIGANAKGEFVVNAQTTFDNIKANKQDAYLAKAGVTNQADIAIIKANASDITVGLGVERGAVKSALMVSSDIAVKLSKATVDAVAQDVVSVKAVMFTIGADANGNMKLSAQTTFDNIKANKQDAYLAKAGVTNQADIAIIKANASDITVGL
ncbi:MAG: hypothetical protein PHP46_03900, partial [Candidatus Omnitrophica bacterium]|nr:hypothetical protein [Candidatus Omnitrophota bacterium]